MSIWGRHAGLTCSACLSTNRNGNESQRAENRIHQTVVFDCYLKSLLHDIILKNCKDKGWILFSLSFHMLGSSGFICNLWGGHTYSCSLMIMFYSCLMITDHVYSFIYNVMKWFHPFSINVSSVRPASYVFLIICATNFVVSFIDPSAYISFSSLTFHLCRTPNGRCLSPLGSRFSLVMTFFLGQGFWSKRWQEFDDDAIN